jgi:osmotically-inducible protein OsmY
MRILTVLLMAALVLPLLVAQSKVDDRIYDEVRRKLANDPDVKGAAFEVAVKDGVVTLRGKVHNEKAREKAERITKKIKGVVSVDNKLTMFGKD